MKKKSKWSLRAKVQSLVLAAVGAGFAVSMALLTHSASDMQYETAVNHARELARFEAQRVSTKLEKAMQTTRVLAESIGHLHDSGRADRELVNTMLAGVLTDQPDYLAVWTAWEPDAFDGQDSQFINQQGHDGTGRFVPYWHRDGQGRPAVVPLVDYDKPGAGEYYLLPRQTGVSTLMEPYDYDVGGKVTLITTLSTPIMRNGRFIGVAGVDIALSDIQEHIGAVRAYEDGYASLLSHQGVYVGDQRAERVGRQLDLGGDTQALLQAIRDSKEWFQEDGKDLDAGHEVTRLFMPVRLDGIKTPWSLGLTIPTHHVLERVEAMRWQAGVLGIVSAAAVVLLLGWQVNRLVLRPLGGEPEQAAALADRVAHGDFRQVETVRDAHSVMGELVAMQANLSEVVRKVRNSAHSVALASSEISQGNQDLAQRTESQASALEQTASAMEELNATVRQNADRARNARTLASEAATVAGQGGQAMNEMLTTMDAMSASSRQIGDIIGVIDSIAFQTNILALNASVEAARAGELGRGFAVVAAEVRQLAQRSADAAKQIKQLIAHSIQQVDAGSAQAHQVGRTIDDVVQVIAKVASLMNEVSEASDEQSAGVGQVSEAVVHMDNSTQKNAALVEEMAAAATSLSQQAQELVRLVAIFQLPDAAEQLPAQPRALPPVA